MLFIIKSVCMVLCSILLFAGCAGGAPSLEEAILTAEELEVPIEISSELDSSEPAEMPIYVYVCGSVKNPGVYALPLGSRIIAAVECAGGFSEDAAEEAVNLAKQVQDGMQIFIPSKADHDLMVESEEKSLKGFVNINKATLEELCTLRGIGESKAEAILAYRRELGSFNSIEQIKEVSGIGDSLYEQIKEYIYIE